VKITLPTVFVASFFCGIGSNWIPKELEYATNGDTSPGVTLNTPVVDQGEEFTDPEEFDESTVMGKLQWVRWILHHSTANDLPDLWEWSQQMDSENSRSPEARLLHDAMLARWSRVDPEGGIAFLQNKVWINEHYDQQPYHIVLGLWLERDPKAATASSQWKESKHYPVLVFLVNSLPPSSYNQQILPLLSENERNFGRLEDFTREDPVAALAWAKQINNPVKRARAMLDVYMGTDPKTGLEFLKSLPAVEEWEGSRNKLIWALAKTDLDAALEQFEKNPELPISLRG
jgi:hypothetical protein